MTRKTLRALGLALTLGFSAAASAVDWAAYSHDSDPGYRNPNWMSSLPDSRPLSQLSIPGTHDTMARYGGDIAQTQSMTLSMQLQAGVRALDIRCRHINNAFAIHHGLIYQNANFDDVLSVVRDFF